MAASDAGSSERGAEPNADVPERDAEASAEVTERGAGVPADVPERDEGSADVPERDAEGSADVPERDAGRPSDVGSDVDVDRDPTEEVHDGCSRAVPPQLPMRLHNAAGVAAPNGVIYLVGGHDQWGGSLEPARVRSYDPATRTYRELPSVPEALWEYAASAFSAGKLIVYGNSKLWLFDPQTERWSEGSPVPEVLTDRAAAVGADGRVYFFGGWNKFGLGIPIERADAYDPATHNWQRLPDVPFWGMGMSAAESGGRIYAMGRKAAVYDPKTNAWSVLPPQPMPREHGTASTDANGRVIVVTGYGYDPIGFVTATDIYDPSSGSWSAGPAMPLAIAEAPSVRGCNGDILVFGGAQYDGLSDRVLAFTSKGAWVMSK